MKKILETSLGRWSELMFNDGNRVVPLDKVGDIVIERCEDYDVYKKGGVLVYMTEEEHSFYKKHEHSFKKTE